MKKRKKFTTRKTTRGILNHAARLLEKHGWTQGTFVNEKGEMCVVGALSAAALGSPTRIMPQKKMAPLAERLQEAVDNVHLDPHDLVTWNDDIAKSQSEVVATLRRAASL